MKIWQGFGSEHSYDLVLVGEFADIESASEVQEKIKRLEAAAGELFDNEPDWRRDEPTGSEAVWNLLSELRLHDITAAEVRQFGYGHTLERHDAFLVVHTEEGEVQAMIKAILASGGRIEIYSRHDWQESVLQNQPRTIEASGPTEAPTGAN